jgi:hypothetical protein
VEYHDRRGSSLRAVKVPSVPSQRFVGYLAADASRLAALLLGYISPICALVAPCEAGASTAI